MRFYQIGLGMLALAAAAPAAAQDDTAPPPAVKLSGGVTLVSDYRFRGLTQSNENGAAQATLNVNTRIGFYAGTWMSTIDGNANGTTPLLRGYGNAEIDLYGGFTKTFKNGLGVDVGLLYYYYPGQIKSLVPNSDFFEPYASINYTIGPVNAKLGAAYAWGGQDGLDFTGGKDDNIYGYGELSAAIPKTPITLKGHLGYTNGSLGLANLSGNDDSYLDWSVTAEAVGGPFKVGVSYVDTDITDTKGSYFKGDNFKFDKFAQRYGRGSTVLGYIGYSF